MIANMVIVEKNMRTEDLSVLCSATELHAPDISVSLTGEHLYGHTIMVRTFSTMPGGPEIGQTLIFSDWILAANVAAHVARLGYRAILDTTCERRRVRIAEIARQETV